MTDLLSDSLESVKDESSFLRFVELLHQDRLQADSTSLTADGFQGEWANQTIEALLEAALAWANDSDFGARPGPKPSNPWQQFALFLWAGRGYE
jgi:hypothetical protein